MVTEYCWKRWVWVAVCRLSGGNGDVWGGSERHGTTWSFIVEKHPGGICMNVPNNSSPCPIQQPRYAWAWSRYLWSWPRDKKWILFCVNLSSVYWNIPVSDIFLLPLLTTPSFSPSRHPSIHLAILPSLRPPGSAPLWPGPARSQGGRSQSTTDVLNKLTSTDN